MSATNNANLVGYMSKIDATQIGEHLKVTFGLVQNYKVKDQEKAEWIECEAWGKTAEVIQRFRENGGQVAIQGEIRVDSWEKDGQTRKKTYFKVTDVKLQGTKADNAKEQGPVSPTTSSSNDYSDDYALNDDELPPF